MNEHRPTSHLSYAFFAACACLLFFASCGSSNVGEVNCDNGDTQTIDCVRDFKPGFQAQICGGYTWHNQGECITDSECIPSSIEDTEKCGLNGNGTKARQCTLEGKWTAWSECDDPDTCTNGDTKTQNCDDSESTIQKMECSQGSWRAIGACEAPCTDGAVRSQECGDSADKVQKQVCTDGTWADDSGCIDACEPGTKQVDITCGLNDRGKETLLCTNEHVWITDVPCDENEECVDDTTKEIQCGYEMTGLQQRLCVHGFYQDSGECVYSCNTETGSDVPDEFGADTNCDHVDGDVDLAIFVSPQGDNAKSGESPEDAVKTLKEALRRITDNPSTERNQILLQAGTYAPQATITIPDGLGIYGGYNADFTERNWDPTATKIKGTTPKTIVMENITKPTILQNLTVIGGNSTHSDTVTYAIWIKTAGPETVQLHNLRVEGGYGLDGKNGANGKAGLRAAPGNERYDNRAGVQARCSDAGDGGDGTVLPIGSCDWPPNPKPTAGHTGSNGNAAGGQPGTSGHTKGCQGYSSATSGTEGEAGGNAPYPEAAISAFTESATIGTFDAHDGLTLVSNVDGNPGRGGGGGGGGGAGGKYASDGSQATAISPVTAISGASGGGGAGSCGGEGGSHGENGGSTVAIAIIDAAPIFKGDNSIIMGDGGDGGKGGDGGNGVKGGDPNKGAQGMVSGGKKGASGGRGGASSGGTGAGGGAGGSAIGIAVMGDFTVPTDDIVFSGGNEGLGGAGGAGGTYPNVTPPGQTAPEPSADGPHGPDGMRKTIYYAE